MDDAGNGGADGLAVIDVPNGLKRCGGDRDLYHLLLAALPEQADEDMAGLRADFAQGRLAEAARRIHSLRGSCSNLGAVRLAQTLFDLEETIKTGDAEASRAGLAGLERTVTETCRRCFVIIGKS